MSPRVLLTGFPATNNKAATEFLRQHWQVIDLPLQQNTFISDSVCLLPPFDIALFTSPAAAEHYLQHLYPLNQKIPFVACLGPATAQMLKDYGIPCQLMPENGTYNAASLAKAVLEKFGSELQNKRLFFPCSVLAANNLQQELEPHCARFIRHEIYRPELRRELQDGQLPSADAVCFFSPSAVHAFEELYGLDALRSLQIAAIGNTTKESLNGLGLAKIIIAAEESAKATANSLITAFESK